MNLSAKVEKAVAALWQIFVDLSDRGLRWVEYAGLSDSLKSQHGLLMRELWSRQAHNTLSTAVNLVATWAAYSSSLEFDWRSPNPTAVAMWLRASELVQTVAAGISTVWIPVA